MDLVSRLRDESHEDSTQGQSTAVRVHSKPQLPQKERIGGGEVTNTKAGDELESWGPDDLD